MNQRLPDWMFAAFAIGGWELSSLVARRWHLPYFRWIGAMVVAACLLVLVSRYTMRFIQRRRNPDVPDPDEWKQY